MLFKKIAMGFSGTNKLCAQCSKECKQYANVKVVCCPTFRSVRAKSKVGDPA